MLRDARLLPVLPLYIFGRPSYQLLFMGHLVYLALLVVSDPFTSGFAILKMSRPLDGAIDPVPFPIAIWFPIHHFPFGESGFTVGMVLDGIPVDDFFFLFFHGSDYIRLYVQYICQMALIG